jgi:uncharacterized Fe-S cluster-containing radical SAM superfamily protein
MLVFNFTYQKFDGFNGIEYKSTVICNVIAVYSYNYFDSNRLKNGNWLDKEC